MNSFRNFADNCSNMKYTENGAKAYKSTDSRVYDMFAFGGAYRERDNKSCIDLFHEAFNEDAELAMKCLFYLRDVRGGQGERRFFRTCMSWLAQNESNSEEYKAIQKNLALIPEYGRWDDLIEIAHHTPLWKEAVSIITNQLINDVKSDTPSLLGKWMPSENASSRKTKALARDLRTALGLSPRTYRKTLSVLRKKINVLERLMSSNQWDQIEFDKIPSKAGLIYKEAFARRDVIASKYRNFISSDDTKVNADALYPYEVVKQALKNSCEYGYYGSGTTVSREAVNKYWNNLPDYFNGADSSMLCVCDTSGSMCGDPMHMAIGLSIYAAEHNKGELGGYYISFASRPQFIKIEGKDFVEKVCNIYETNLCDNTNLEAVFNLLKNAVLSGKVDEKDLPETLVVISDMEIDEATANFWNHGDSSTWYRWTVDSSNSLMENIRDDWFSYGLKLPRLVYWNVNARNNTILDGGDNVTFVSGNSPILFESIVKGYTGVDLMLEKLNSERYAQITI